MRRFLKGGLAGLFVLLVLLGSLTVHTILSAQTNGRLINYVGIVRGATQRLVKLELQRQQNDEMSAYLDGILTELGGGPGPYGLPFPQDEAYRQNLEQLNLMWARLKEAVQGYRLGTVTAQTLVAQSEDYYIQANKTVFAADAFAARQTRILLGICIGMLGVMLATWAFIFWAGARRMLSLESSNRQLGDMARRDALTGAYRLEAFREEAQREIEEHPKARYALLYTDFSDFKYINDVFGYDYGDHILKRYGELLRQSLEEGEMYGRVSADNFVLLRRYEKREKVVTRQKSIDEAIIRFMHSSYDRQALPTCCGICCVEDVTEDLKVEGLLDRANFARKTVKNGANLNYVFYNESIRRHLQEVKAVESRMAGALERREFLVYYQPKVELQSGKVASAEALVRWQTKEGEIISPDRFIPVFEQNRMIGKLDQYVFEEVCAFLRRSLDAGSHVLPVSVNVSRLQFYDQDFVGRYLAIRNHYHIPPELVEIEFTESIVFGNLNLLGQIVRELKNAGFACSIDDFGKGYSSMSLLKDLPIDYLKIDKFFFDEGEDKQRDLAVVQGVIELVKRFHIRTVAEGIESQEQVQFLKEIGCDYVQGYVFYRPMPQEAYARLLKTA